MKLNVKAFAVAHSALACILFVLCRLVYTLAPEGSITAMKYFYHTDWSSVAVPVTWGGFFFGLIMLMLFGTLVGATLASTYNFMVHRSSGPSIVASAGQTKMAA
jgi:hypothetical protein